MATSIKSVNELISWYLETAPDARLSALITSSPLKEDGGTRDRAALRRVYKQLEKIEGARNVLLEEFASDTWNTNQLKLFEDKDFE